MKYFFGFILLMLLIIITTNLNILFKTEIFRVPHYRLCSLTGWNLDYLYSKCWWVK